MAGSTTTQYKTGISGGFPAQIDSNAAQPSVREDFDIIDPTKTELLTAIGGDRQWTEDKSFTHYWLEDDLYTDILTLEAVGINDSTTAINLSANDSYRCQVGDVIQIDDELMRVTAIADANTLTVVRGYATSTAAAHNASSTIYVVTITEEEGGDSPYVGHATKSKPYNIMQKLEAAVELTKEAMTLDEYGNMMKLEEERAKINRKLKMRLEGMLFRGLRYVGADANNPGMSGGLNYFLTAANGANVVDLNGAAITEANILTLLRSIRADVGTESQAEDAWMGDWVLGKFYAMYENRIRTTAGETTGGGVIDKVITPHGQVRLHYARQCQDTILYLLNHKYLNVGHWKGFDWSVEELSKQGFYKREARGAVKGFEVRHVQTQGKIQEISVAA